MAKTFDGDAIQQCSDLRKGHVGHSVICSHPHARRWRDIHEQRALRALSVDSNQTTTERQPTMINDQTPAAPDYRRAAQLYLHRERKNARGFNAVLPEADQLGRLSALVLAIINIA